MIKIKRIYEQPLKDDGFRILVDRLWPRGISKDKARIDLWLKEIAPSDQLRKWFAHDPAKWVLFKQKYFSELEKKNEILKRAFPNLKDNITLLYAAKDNKYNNALALKEYLELIKVK